MKKIWIVNHYAMPPEIEPRPRTIKFAEYLTKKGYQVTVFAASSIHNTNKNLISGKETYIERQYGTIHFVHVKARSYTNTLSRILNLLSFPIRLRSIAHHFAKPDIILYTAAIPFGNSIYYLAKKLKAKFLVEVLDLWPESFVMTGILKKNNPVMPFLYFCEKWLYRRADHLIFSMEGGSEYIRDKGWDKDHNGPIDMKRVAHINNGVDIQEYESNLQKYELDDIDVNDESMFKIVYIGSIRLFNNVGLLIHAAEQMRDQKDVVILIYGDGDERKTLEKYVLENKLTNVRFKEKFIDKKYIPYLLSRSSINVLNYQQNGIWKYGGSQTKLFQYMASGKPIVSNTVSKYCLIRRYDCGISQDFKTGQEYAEAFMRIKNLSESEYCAMCQNARNAAKEYDYDKLTNDLKRLF